MIREAGGLRARPVFDRQVPCGRELSASPLYQGKGVGGWGEVPYLQLGGSPFIANQQEVTLPVHHNLLLESAA